MEVFPDIKTVSFDRTFVIFHVAKLPEKPWPITIAGVGCYLTTMEGDSGPMSRILSHAVAHFSKSKFEILKDIDARGKTVGSNTALFDRHVEKAFEYFEKKRVKITQLQNWNDFVVIILKDKDQMTDSLPCRIMQMTCFVLLDDDIRPGKEPALRHKEPRAADPVVRDDARYEVLRPGIMVTSERDDKGISLTSTSGVYVEDESGNKFLTVAAHGFPKNGAVHHPDSDGRVIGSIVRSFSQHFDISLVRLGYETFVNETFEAPEEGCPGVRLLRLAELKNLRLGDLVSMNNPYLGRCDGRVSSISYHPKTKIEGCPEQYWLTTAAWIWTGQGSSSQMIDGICGTPVVSEDKEVVGFFRFAGKDPLADFCYSTAAENLCVRGYKICQQNTEAGSQNQGS